MPKPQVVLLISDDAPPIAREPGPRSKATIALYDDGALEVGAGADHPTYLLTELQLRELKGMVDKAIETLAG